MRRERMSPEAAERHLQSPGTSFALPGKLQCTDQEKSQESRARNRCHRQSCREYSSSRLGWKPLLGSEKLHGTIPCQVSAICCNTCHIGRIHHTSAHATLLRLVGSKKSHPPPPPPQVPQKLSLYFSPSFNMHTAAESTSYLKQALANSCRDSWRSPSRLKAATLRAEGPGSRHKGRETADLRTASATGTWHILTWSDVTRFGPRFLAKHRLAAFLALLVCPQLKPQTAAENKAQG